MQRCTNYHYLRRFGIIASFEKQRVDFLFFVLPRRKHFIIMNKFTYQVIILAAALFMLAGTGLAVFSNTRVEGNRYGTHVADHEDKQMIQPDGSDIDEQTVHNFVPSFRVLFQQVLKQFRGRQTPFHWLSNLNMSLHIFSIVLGGGIFLLFLFYASLPNQFCVKLNITHKSDGKKRPL